MAKRLSKEQSDATMNERIIEIATKLFADKGYQAVSTREIADSLGINISTFHYHTGGKSNLYKSVIESLYQGELHVLNRPVLDFKQEDFQDKEKVSKTLLIALEGFLDLMLKDPHRSHLYVRRWLEWPDELMQQEVKVTLKTFQPLKDFLEKSKLEGSIRNVDTSIFIRSFLWMTYGYFITGIIDWKNWVSDPFKKKNMNAFKEYMRDYTQRMLFENV
ncbi:MAG: TetR/AcrR family transcriptional regulator [Leptospiraceae bacterium]|nr:TetR/AcrR family transcriptional regulator [Leptospiraceae bacterium]